MDAIVEEPEPECEFDGPWKEAIEWFFEPFLEFFFPQVYANIDVERGHEFLDKELEPRKEMLSRQWLADHPGKTSTDFDRSAWPYLREMLSLMTKNI